MRVTKNRKNDDSKHKVIAEQLKAIGDKYKVRCYDILFDLYNLFRNKGQSLDADPKTLEALRKTDPARYWIARDEFHRQRAVFTDISKSDLYKALLTKAPLVAVEEVCKWLHEMHVRIKAAKEQPASYGNRLPAMNDRHGNHDEHDNQMFEASKEQEAERHGQQSPFELTDPLQLMGQLFGDMNNPAGASIFAMGASPYLFTNKLDKPDKDAQWLLETAKRYCAKGGSNFFKWVANVADKAGFEEKKDIVTPELSQHKKNEQMDSVADVVNANPADLQRPDLEKQIVDKTLDVTKNTASTVDKAHAVVLLDVSGSMGMPDIAGGRCDRALYAFCLIFAMLQKVIERGDCFHVILFEGSPHPPISAGTSDEAVRMVNQLCHHSRWGGGTCIQSALNAGIKLVAQMQKVRHADIILITDGEACVDVKGTRASLPPRTKIRGVHIGNCSRDAKKQMFDLCDAAMVAEWDDKEDMPKLGNLLKGV
jgi:Mg-chelatase subunit ChlD